MNKYSKVLVSFVLFLLLFLAWRVYGVVGVSANIEEQDIYYSFKEGQRILNGENPYERVLKGDMLHNNKYATYFPLFYELSFLTQKIGLEQFDSWLVFWRRIFIVFNLGTAALLFYLFQRADMDWAGIFAAAFWLFNRWTLTVVSIVHLDFPPVFLLVASLVVFPKVRWLGLILFSISLALKQIGIFILPLFLVWTWLSVDRHRFKELMIASLLTGIIPLLTSIPFLIWNARGFLTSVLFSVTRLSSGSLSVLSLDEAMGWSGLVGRLPMFILFAAIYWFCQTRSIGRYTSVFLIMLIFVSFNATLFPQYLVWLTPFALLLPLDLKDAYSITKAGA